MRRCFKCGTPLDDKQEVFRATTCASCRADLRCCRNCEFYKPGAHWDCRESVDEQVIEKERANFCGWFRFRSTPEAGKGVPPGDAKAASPQAQRAQLAHDKFDKLFGG
jgi:hypothetical protein